MIEQVVKETPVIVTFLEGALTAIVPLLVAAWPFFNWWDKRQKHKQAQKEAIEEEARAKLPKYIELHQFQEFAKGNEEAHGAVKKLIGEAIGEFGATQTAVLKIGEEVNAVKVDVGNLQGKMESMPDVVVGKMLQQIYHIDPPKPPPEVSDGEHTSEKKVS